MQRRSVIKYPPSLTQSFAHLNPSKPEEKKDMERKRVCIIGAGVSGLTACKHVLSKGFVPTVFRAGPPLRASGTTLARPPASPQAFYRFSDHPWPKEVTDTYPDHVQVREYLRSYARKFNVLEHVRFGTKVAGVEYVGASEEEIMTWDMWAGNGEAFGSSKGVWHVRVQHGDEGELEVH
ncbi:uncharacterized protein A4U43_C01F17960 [Asparagus officinalis]|uniref:Flavin-containing monooxygenase n=1 Tax=Asparagus officinalis TaxID=4686 RepID=A0A5P1FQU5_ASPOF|nr:uncharacterized protein A4U43_C01F17960 [Asparagus officinalis]